MALNLRGPQHHLLEVPAATQGVVSSGECISDERRLASRTTGHRLEGGVCMSEGCGHCHG